MAVSGRVTRKSSRGAGSMENSLEVSENCGWAAQCSCRIADSWAQGETLPDGYKKQAWTEEFRVLT